ncbi:MAG TPA: hypothetical protein VJ777_22915 [Mycobacterium sp.]|nr:hypothetical protein [Mycobacterium sp.]
MNRHPYSGADIVVATETLRRWYGENSEPEFNHAIAAVSVLDAVMVARHKREDALPFWKRLILALAR